LLVEAEDEERKGREGVRRAGGAGGEEGRRSAEGEKAWEKQ